MFFGVDLICLCFSWVSLKKQKKQESSTQQSYSILFNSADRCFVLFCFGFSFAVFNFMLFGFVLLFSFFCVLALLSVFC